MEVVVYRSELVSMIGALQGVVPSRPVVSVLSSVLIEAKGDQLILTATDLTVSMQARCKARIHKEGAIALPAKRFFQLVREMTVPEITLESQTEGVTMITGGTARFRLHGMDCADFPIFPDLSSGTQFTMPSRQLKDLLVKTSFACARDDSRPAINGIYLSIEGNQMILVGTDGKRLAKVHDMIDYHNQEPVSMIIPLKAVEEMIRLLDQEDNVKVSCMSDKLSIEVDSLTLVSRLLSGQFPDFTRVIPEYNKMENVVIHREELLALLKQVSLFTSETSHSVLLVFDKGELKLQSSNSMIGEGNVNMLVDYDREKLEIAFNPHHFIDILRHSNDETINFGVIDSFNPGSITDSSKSHFVIMPMRLVHV